MQSQHDSTQCLELLSATGQFLRPVTHLTRTVATLSRQVLPMDQRAGGSTALQWEPGINESGGSGVVVNKKRLGNNPLNSQHTQHTCLSQPTISHIREKTNFWVIILAPFSPNFKSLGGIFPYLFRIDQSEKATLKLDHEWREHEGTLFLVLENTLRDSHQRYDLRKKSYEWTFRLLLTDAL